MTEEEKNAQEVGEMSFWDHLEVLSGTIFRSLLAISIISVVVFCFKKFVFDDVVLAPTRSDFWVYKLLNMDVNMNLVNLEISTQFFVHLKVAFQLGFILSFPFIVWEIWKFIAPALYQNEKKTVRGVFLAASFLFESPHLPQNAASWASILTLAIVCSGFGFTLQPVAQSGTSAETAGLLCALNPLVASVLGVVFLHEVLSAKAILGGLLVLAGILLYSVKTKPAE